MRLSLAMSAILSALLLATGCATSTPQSRISRNREAYRSFPADVQRKISAGVVDVGFTAPMVELALGEPDREFSQRAENGNAEVWVYHDKGPQVFVGFGIGFGTYGRHSSSSVAVGTSTGGYEREEKMRIVFRDGQVTEIEHRKR